MPLEKSTVLVWLVCKEGNIIVDLLSILDHLLPFTKTSLEMVSMTTSSTRPSIPCSWKGKWCRKGTVTRTHKNNGTWKVLKKKYADRMQHFRLWYCHPSFMKVHIEMIWKLKHYKTIYFGLARYINWIFVKSKRYEINDDFSTYFDSKQLYCGLIHIHMGAQLLQISANKWVPHIHKPTHHMNHETQS